MFHFVAKENDGRTEQVARPRSAASSRLSGSYPLQLPFTSCRRSPPAHHVFVLRVPPRFPSTTSSSHPAFITSSSVLWTFRSRPVKPGDTIHTTTVDAGGTDHDNVRRVLGGNPQTGPFYIESAVPGDTLVVHILRLRLNRDWAVSDDDLVERATNSRLAIEMKDGGQTVIWHLDLANGIASPAKPAEHLAHSTDPLFPMLGCIATAPGPAQAPPGTGDSGSYGGNMDFNEIDGTWRRVHLPVSNPGALLYLGDAHAAQGDGELNGNALETSMDVEFSVDVIPNKRTPAPRIETSTSIMAMGCGVTRRRVSWRHLQYGPVARRGLQTDSR